MLFVFMASPGVASASITNTRADAWGTLELSGSSWLGGSGVDVYSNGASVTYTPDKPNNSVGGVTSGEKWQCVELVNRLYLSRGWTTSTWTGSGNTMKDHVPSGLTFESNGSITYLNPGDVITLDDGVYGHAAIINSVSGSTVQIVNQNTTAVYSSASFSGGTLTMSGWGGYTVQGVVHAPSSGGGGGIGNSTVGMFDTSAATFYMRMSNTAGSSENTFQFGFGGATPVVGDWDGNGTDTIGVVNTSTQTFYLRNSNNAGSADAGTVQFGAGGWKPIVGDWDGIGSDGFGSYDPSTSTFYLKNVIAAGSADAIFQFGAGGSLPIVGDWNGDGVDTIGVVDPSTQTFYLRNSNNAGSADAGVVQFGAGGWLPIVGDWDNQ